MISNGYTSITLKDILNKVDEGQILNFYFGITQVPFRMNSPLRNDSKVMVYIYIIKTLQQENKGLYLIYLCKSTILVL